VESKWWNDRIEKYGKFHGGSDYDYGLSSKGVLHLALWAFCDGAYYVLLIHSIPLMIRKAEIPSFDERVFAYEPFAKA